MNINNFRQCIEDNIIPNKSLITYKGIFNEYYFNTKTNIENKENNDELLFYPTYCYAKCKKPKLLQSLNNNNNNNDIYECYLSIYLNSNIPKEYFKRPKLNLVICLDINNSMINSFKNDYSSLNKIELATNTIISILSQLKNDDRFGFITFNNNESITHFKLNLIKMLIKIQLMNY